MAANCTCWRDTYKTGTTELLRDLTKWSGTPHSAAFTTLVTNRGKGLPAQPTDAYNYPESDCTAIRNHITTIVLCLPTETRKQNKWGHKFLKSVAKSCLQLHFETKRKIITLKKLISKTGMFKYVRLPAFSFLKKFSSTGFQAQNVAGLHCRRIRDLFLTTTKISRLSGQSLAFRSLFVWMLFYTHQ